jgi:hypothetical protein
LDLVIVDAQVDIDGVAIDGPPALVVNAVHPDGARCGIAQLTHPHGG